MFQHILVVCTGNICRSPLAAAMLQAQHPQRHLHSAGLAALVDAPADPTARELAAADGYDLEGHRARSLTREMLQQADLVLVMSESQRHAVGKLSPEALGKTLRLGQWLKQDEGDQGRDIPDPYRKSREAFEQIYRLIARASAEWAKRL